MSFKQRILFEVILFAFLVVCYTTIASNYQAPKHTSNNLPRWITEEKIRAGYLYAKDDTKYAALMRKIGLNTLIVKGNLHHKNEFEKTVQGYRRWAQTAKKENLHLFIAFNWQLDRDFDYRHVVYSDGSVGIAPCPHDCEYWNSYLIRVGKAVAELSLKPDLQIDGIFLDCELYGSSGAKRYYGRHTCFCDNCFSTFLLNRGFKGPNLPLIVPADRKKWLQKKNLLDHYFDLLAKKVKLRARKFEQEIHAINPVLTLGMYPSPKNWVLKAMARGFEAKQRPIIIFATDTYEGGGVGRIPRNGGWFYGDQQINAMYVAGFLFRAYSSEALAHHLPLAYQRCEGYWLFRMPMLWGEPDTNNRLSRGGQGDYRQAIKGLNDKIEEINNLKLHPKKRRQRLNRWRVRGADAALGGSHTYNLPTVHFRGEQRFLVYVKKGKDILLLLNFKRIAYYKDALEYTVISPSGDKVVSEVISKTGLSELSFKALETGMYEIQMDVGKCAFVIESSNSPIGVLGECGFKTIGHVDKLYFYVSDVDTEVVIVGESNHGWGLPEPFHMRVTDPRGMVFGATTDPGRRDLIIRIGRPELESGLWSVSIEKAADSSLEDAYFYFGSSSGRILSFRPEWVFFRD